MKFEVYDKAKWHYESKDMPNELLCCCTNDLQILTLI